MSPVIDFVHSIIADIEATVLLPIFKSATITTQGLGVAADVFAFGFYEWSVGDANLNQASATQTFGGANVSHASHAFIVAGGAGTVASGAVGLRVNGVSIDDQGTRMPGDTEILTSDITSLALNQYLETSKKWLGTVTFELFIVSGTPATYSLDFNYGLAKYDDWSNNDFTIVAVECVGFAGGNDADFNIQLLHHRTTDWTYSAAAFTPINAARVIVSLVGDHATDDQLDSGVHFAWKRSGLSTDINGANGEGFLIFADTSSNNSIEYLNMHVGATPT